MVVQEQAVPPCAVQLGLPLGHALFHLHERQRRQIPLLFSGLLVHDHVLKLEYHGELPSVGIAVELRVLRVSAPRFTHGDQVALLECLTAHLLQELVESGAVVGDLLIRLLSDLVDHIQTKTSHAFVHPPEDHVIDLPAYPRILPIQVRLFHGKLMEIVLFQFRHPLPCRSAEGRFHIVWEFSLHTVSPHIVVVVWIVFSFLRLQKPSVLVRCMVQHQVHDDPDIPFLRLRDQFLHIRKGSEHGIDVLIIRDVVSVVILG